MSSNAQAIVQSLVLDNYISLVVIAVLVYDYMLTFLSEIEYIWCRRWSWVSTTFVLVRYVGLCWAFTEALAGTSLISGPRELNRCAAIYVVSGWSLQIFLCAADLMMILRVYAMWNRSRSILRILLFIYSVQIITAISFCGVYYTSSTRFSVSLVGVFEFSFCNTSPANTPQMLYLCDKVPRLVLDAILLILAVFQTMKQSLEVHKATKQWLPNRYMQLLMKDGIFYFVMNTFFNIAGIIQAQDTLNSNVILALCLVCYTTIPCMMPRFIIGVRELYECDLNGRWQGVDTGFGVSSRLDTTVMSTVVFADVAHAQDQSQDSVSEGDVDDPNAVRLELSGNGSWQV